MRFECGGTPSVCGKPTWRQRCDSLWVLCQLLSLLGLLGLAPALAAQTTYLRIDPTATQIDLAPASEMLEDPSNTLTLAQVQQPQYAQRFQRKSPSAGFTTSAYWLRFRLHVPKSSGPPPVWWFNTQSRTLQEISLFTKDSKGLWQAQSASSDRPFAERPLPTANFVFPLTFNSLDTDTEIYLRVRSTGFIGINIAPQLWQPEAYAAMEKSQKIQWVVYLGMAAALSLFSLLLGIFIRHSHYLLYSASVVGIAWSISSSGGGFGSAYEILWPNAPGFEQTAWLVSTFAGIFFNIHFFLQFANFKAKLPRMTIFLSFCLTAFGITMFLGLIGTHALPTSAPILQSLHIVGPGILAVMYLNLAGSLLWLASKGNRQAQFLCVAWFPAFFSITIWAWSVIREQPFNIGFAMWTSAFELILMSLGLADLFNQAKKAKEQAQARVFELLQRSEHELEEKVARRTQELQQEHQRNEELLHNILPIDIANELSETGSARPARHNAVSILFTDFIGFTEAVAHLPVDRIIAELNEIFAAFDDITDTCGIEKIKTIGDAYMAVAGLPKPCTDHAQRCVRAALLMLNYLQQRNQTSQLKWLLRVGIHSGPVVAGVVGKRKFAFDIWGDSVNVAARMESAGENGRVNISASTHALIRNDFSCEYRGKLNVKGKGMLDMYFVMNTELIHKTA